MQSKNLGDYLRQLREKEKMPLFRLALLLNVDQITLDKIEKGEKPVTRQMLPAIAKTFNLPENELLLKFMMEQLTHETNRLKESNNMQSKLGQSLHNTRFGVLNNIRK